MITITLNTTRQIKSQVIDPGNEERGRERQALSTDRQSRHVQYTRDRLSDCTILAQASATVLHKPLH